MRLMATFGTVKATGTDPLSSAEWFEPLADQGEIPFAFLNRFSRRFTNSEAIAVQREATGT